MKRLLLFVFLVPLLSACLPVRESVLDIINNTGRAEDGTEVSLLDGSGVTVTPTGIMESTVLSVLGETLTVNDGTCEAIETNDAGLQTTSCFLDTIDEALTLNVTGTKRSAFLSWLVEGDPVRRFLVVTELSQ